MPFIKKKRRKIIDTQGLEGLAGLEGGTVEPGDRCYVFYSDLMKQWKDTPKWRTVHQLYLEHLANRTSGMNDDDYTAAELAWQVFFALEVVPYEKAARKRNGAI
jgi:hypothetical protein